MSTHDIESSRATYAGFMNALKWIVPLIAIIALTVIALIAD